MYFLSQARDCKHLINERVRLAQDSDIMRLVVFFFFFLSIMSYNSKHHGLTLFQVVLPTPAGLIRHARTYLDFNAGELTVGRVCFLLTGRVNPTRI